MLGTAGSTLYVFSHLILESVLYGSNYHYVYFIIEKLGLGDVQYLMQIWIICCNYNLFSKSSLHWSQFSSLLGSCHDSHFTDEQIEVKFKSFKKINVWLPSWVGGSNRFQTQVCQIPNPVLFPKHPAVSKNQIDKCCSVMLDQKEVREIKWQGKLVFRFRKPFMKLSHTFLLWYLQNLIMCSGYVHLCR